MQSEKLNKGKELSCGNSGGAEVLTICKPGNLGNLGGPVRMAAGGAQEKASAVCFR
jgi:hypothetical protein